MSSFHRPLRIRTFVCLAVLAGTALLAFYIQSGARPNAVSSDFPSLPIKESYVTYRYSVTEVRKGYGLDATRDPRLLGLQITGLLGKRPSWMHNTEFTERDVLIRRAAGTRDPLLDIVHPAQHRAEIQLILFAGSPLLQTLEPSAIHGNWDLNETEADRLASKLQTFEFRSAGTSGETHFALLDDHVAHSTFFSDEVAYLESVTPVGTGSAGAFDPNLAIAQSVVSVECAASFGPDARLLLLKVQSRAQKLTRLTDTVRHAVNGVPTAYIQVPETAISEDLREIHLSPRHAIVFQIAGTKAALRLSDPGRLFLFVRRLDIPPKIEPF